MLELKETAVATGLDIGQGHRDSAQLSDYAEDSHWTLETLGWEPSDSESKSNLFHVQPGIPVNCWRYICSGWVSHSWGLLRQNHMLLRDKVGRTVSLPSMGFFLTGWSGTLEFRPSLSGGVIRFEVMLCWAGPGFSPSGVWQYLVMLSLYLRTASFQPFKPRKQG